MSFKGMSRLGDITTGHGCYSPVTGVSASPNVKINGRFAHKVGDTFTPHNCGTSVHSDVAAVGSSTVLINGTGAMRIGDTLAPGGSMAAGSWDVFAG
tara:strand:- start:365 stop:655 length:291 start_codon:yes stop_codon:yes gene_type:complete